MPRTPWTPTRRRRATLALACRILGHRLNDHLIDWTNPVVTCTRCTRSWQPRTTDR